METTHTPNERTPLLGDLSVANRLGPLFRTSSEQTQPSDASGTISNGQATLDENGAVCSEHSQPFGQSTSADSDIEPLISCPRTFEQETNEVSLEEVVQALCSAWQRNRQYNREVTLNYFTTKELCAMHLAWQNVTRGRHCFSQPHIIAEALASAIEDCRNPRPQTSEDDSHINFYIYTTAERCTLAVNLLREWERISEGFGFPVRYIETVFDNSKGPPTALSEFRRRKVELYDKVHDFFLHPILQIILHSLLIIWPISNVIVGSKYMECPIDHLSHLLIALGCIGCFAILVRLALMYLTSKAQNPYHWSREWVFLRVIELTFLTVFIVEAFHFFKTDPSTVLDINQCANFYIVALVLNYVSITLASTYVLVYTLKICANQFDAWIWIFKHL